MNSNVASSSHRRFLAAEPLCDCVPKWSRLTSLRLINAESRRHSEDVAGREISRLLARYCFFWPGQRRGGKGGNGNHFAATHHHTTRTCSANQGRDRAGFERRPWHLRGSGRCAKQRKRCNWRSEPVDKSEQSSRNLANHRDRQRQRRSG